MTVYYNEFDPQVAAWLRVLIAEGHIAPGVVDERSIEDVRPSDLRGFKQCHFFAGIGVWSYALRRAGWRDDRPIWTGSCPCQPFSAAGKGAGFDDERHLWPAFQWLIQECAPECVVGEQVASAAVDDWIDLVHADLEALGYAFGSVPFPAAGVGAPHIRDRNYWAAIRMADSYFNRLQGRAIKAVLRERRRQEGNAVGRSSAPFAGGLGDAELPSEERHRQYSGKMVSEQEAKGFGLSGTADGFWRHVDWLPCSDGKSRPVEPGTFPLATGASARVVRLRGYGNAVNAEQARAWIETVMECLPC